jgi:alpha-methylacyl-CoA racemase
MIGKGPLASVKVLEIQGIGPGPFAAMMLSDLGANVLRVARPSNGSKSKLNPVLDRGRSGQIELDLKSEDGKKHLLQLVQQANVLIEGYRPGVMERLELGPDECMERNSQLVYGRITGWGRSGPLAQSVGHDINYIAITGALHACGSALSGPVPPLNLVGDFGGGGMLLAMGITTALFESKISGKGQVVDVAMVDGAAMLMSMIYGLKSMGRWPAERAGNIFDGSAYFYSCYSCADGKWVAVGAIEPNFRLAFFRGLGVEKEAEAMMRASDDDPIVRARIASIILGKTRSQWQEIFDGTDACVSPVLSIEETTEYPHNIAWGSMRRIDGVIHPMPGPRFSRTPAADPNINEDRLSLLDQWPLGNLNISPVI